MGHNGANGHQPDLPLFTPPEVIIPAIRIPQPGGCLLIKPGAPIVLEDTIGTREASRLLGQSIRWVQHECEAGLFTTAFKPGTQPKSHWKIARTEVLRRRLPDP
jgi:hypothetical protein